MKPNKEYYNEHKLKQYTAIADDLTRNDKRFANSKGEGQDFKDFMEETNKVIKTSPSPAAVDAAKQSAGDFTSTFVLKCLYQEITEHPSLSYMDFVDLFDDEVLTNGNSKEFNNQLITGYENFDKNKFVPDEASPVFGESHLFNMFKREAGGAVILEDGNFQFKKPVSITEAQWLPYFTSGKLGVFVSMVIETVDKCYRIFKFNLIGNLLKDLNPKRKITGKAPNLFEAMYKEIFPELQEMGYLSSDYNYGPLQNGEDSKFVTNTEPSKLLMIMHPKTKSALTGGVQSQLFNKGLISPEQFIKPENIKSVGKQITIGDSKTPIKVNPNAPHYVPETRIIVMDPDAIRFITQINTKESQAYAENLTLQIYLHVWGGVTILPWGQVFVYDNPNLNRVPSEETAPITVAETASKKDVKALNKAQEALETANMTIESLTAEADEREARIHELEQLLMEKEIGEEAAVASLDDESETQE